MCEKWIFPRVISNRNNDRTSKTSQGHLYDNWSFYKILSTVIPEDDLGWIQTLGPKKKTGPDRI